MAILVFVGALVVVLFDDTATGMVLGAGLLSVGNPILPKLPPLLLSDQVRSKAALLHLLLLLLVLRPPDLVFLFP